MSMYYHKPSGLFIPKDEDRTIIYPGANRHNVEANFVTRTARRIADGVIEKHRTGMPMNKAINIMVNQLKRVARKQKGKAGAERVERIKAEITRILKEEG